MKPKPINDTAYKNNLFDLWNDLGIALEALQPRLSFHEREVWSCHIGLNIGDKQMGMGDEFLRPVIVVKKFNSRVFWAVPLTRTVKDHPYYMTFEFILNMKSSAILSQLRLIDARRLHHFIGRMTKKDFSAMKKRLATLLS